MRWLIATLAVIVLSALAHAQNSARSDADIANEAEAAFQRGIASGTKFLQARKHFAEAVDRYLELHERGMRNPALYRNLGNAAALADRWPLANWAYQMGLALDPNDAIMREHLDFARSKVLYPPSGEGRLEADTWPAWLHRPTLFEWFAAFAACYGLACLAATWSWLKKSRSAMLAAIVLTAASLASGGGWWHQQRRADFERESPVVIVADNTAFYQGNAASYPPHSTLPMLPRGMEARQIHVRGNWLQIRLATGETGWLPRTRVLVVQ